MVTQSGDATESAETIIDSIERESRDRAIKAMLADSKARHHEIVAETELNIDYSRSPIVSGDANGCLAPGDRLPGTIPVHQSNGQSYRLHELSRRTGHTLMLLAGANAHGSEVVNLYAALQELATDSLLFEAAIAVGTGPDLPGQIGQLEPVAANLLGVEGITVVAVRPDGYVGLRSDRDYLTAIEQYRTLVQAGHP